MTAMLRCELFATSMTLGKLYGVLSKRSGKILKEDMKVGQSVRTTKRLVHLNSIVISGGDRQLHYSSTDPRHRIVWVCGRDSQKDEWTSQPTAGVFALRCYLRRPILGAFYHRRAAALWRESGRTQPSSGCDE